MKKGTRTVWLLAAAMVIALITKGDVRAAVVDTSDIGFTVQYEFTVAATPDKAYRQVVNAVGKWWGSDHTYSGDASNMYMENRAGGCFCERLQGGGSVQHMRVLYAHPGKALNLSGGLGPLQTMAVTGSMAWGFTQVEGGTRINIVYAVGGYFPQSPGSLAPSVDRVLEEQWDRLKRFLETGQPAAPR